MAPVQGRKHGIVMQSVLHVCQLHVKVVAEFSEYPNCFVNRLYTCVGTDQKLRDSESDARAMKNRSHG